MHTTQLSSSALGATGMAGPELTAGDITGIESAR